LIPQKTTLRPMGGSPTTEAAVRAAGNKVLVTRSSSAW
jgi:DNA-binding beta-propeller fold protein YncE